MISHLICTKRILLPPRPPPEKNLDFKMAPQFTVWVLALTALLVLVGASEDGAPLFGVDDSIDFEVQHRRALARLQ